VEISEFGHRAVDRSPLRPVLSPSLQGRASGAPCPELFDLKVHGFEQPPHHQEVGQNA
jgi:hypothetical protein